LQKSKNSGFLRDFSIRAKKHKNDKYLIIIFLCFLALIEKDPKSRLLGLLQLPQKDVKDGVDH
jgi:hypothetical protein